LNRRRLAIKSPGCVGLQHARHQSEGAPFRTLRQIRLWPRLLQKTFRLNPSLGRRLGRLRSVRHAVAPDFSPGLQALGKDVECRRSERATDHRRVYHQNASSVPRPSRISRE